jgi:putative ABC transport system substrate-binding protein
MSRGCPTSAPARLQLLAELVPGLSCVGVVWTPAVHAHQFDHRELQAAAATLGLSVASFEVTRPADYDAAFRQARAECGAAAVLSGAMAFANRTTIVAAAAQHRLPAIYYDAEYAGAGGLTSYGPILLDLHRRAAVFVDKILKGARPADLPVEEPTRYALVVNLMTAAALGLAIPPAILARADEVIE